MATIEHLDEGPPAARAAQTLLFLHGLGGSAESWRAQLDALAPMVRCVAWTMPGYGRSRALRETTIETLADAALSLVDSLGLDRVVVVGQSMGGFVAQELALRHPDRVERLVLVATTAAFGRPTDDGSVSMFNQGLLAARLQPLDDGRRMTAVAREHIPTMVGPDCPALVVKDAAKIMGAIPPAAYRAALEALVTFDTRHRLGALSLPTLCLAGGLDTSATPAAMAELADLIPDARLEIIEGAAHLVNQEQPDEVNRLIRGFLAWM